MNTLEANETEVISIYILYTMNLIHDPRKCEKKNDNNVPLLSSPSRCDGQRITKKETIAHIFIQFRQIKY